MLNAISPIDGRYANKTQPLAEYFSEASLISYRVRVEIQYLIFLNSLGIKGFNHFDESALLSLKKIMNDFSHASAEEIKAIEKTTNHDVKAVEYWIKTKLTELGLDQNKEFVHFGLTSQDINNTAFPMMVRDAASEVLIPAFRTVLEKFKSLANETIALPMLARTHGQAASPTTLGKEIMVFASRLSLQIEKLSCFKHSGKFGGATGNLNAHYIAYPEIDWHHQARVFCNDYLKIERQDITTQIEHYDDLAEFIQIITRANTILLDACRDIWHYVSINYFGQKTIANEVGSSAMPHKVNPIDFENAEGNLGMANAIFYHLAQKLPISRLQRDLTDSTVLRNIGVPIAHTLIALLSLQKGLGKLKINNRAIAEDLDANWAVLAEAYQTILRREGYENPYETLKKLTRGIGGVNQSSLIKFIDDLDIPDDIKEELSMISPHNYTGKVNL